jgi:Protein of unknown function (DUF3040)
VEVAIVLDPTEKRVFDGIVTKLSTDDPTFLRRIDKLGSPRRKLRTAMAVLLWMIAPVCMFLGGWTGFFMAVVAIGYGTYLVLHKPGLAGGTGFSWWSSSGRRPGASL